MAKFSDYISQSVKASKVGGPKILNALNVLKGVIGTCATGVLVGGVSLFSLSKQYPFFFTENCSMSGITISAKTRFKVLLSDNEVTIKLASIKPIEMCLSPEELAAVSNWTPDLNVTSENNYGD